MYVYIILVKSSHWSTSDVYPWWPKFWMYISGKPLVPMIYLLYIYVLAILTAVHTVQIIVTLGIQFI